MSNWQPKSCENCSLHNIGRGFVVGCGDPAQAKIAIVLETPASEEINFGVWPPAGPKKRYVLGDVREAQAEMARRKARYPDIEPRLLARGVPVVGRTGSVLNFRLLEQAGINRDECLIDNSLRCLPAKSAQGANWPTGNAKHIAVSECRQYDRIDEFKPTVIVITCHPAALFREVAPELLMIEDLRKAKEFADQGERVLILMGGKACETFLGYATNVSKWRGHYEFVDAEWLTKRREYLKLKGDKARIAMLPKEKRPKKKTKAEVAREETATTIVNNLIGLGFISEENMDIPARQKQFWDAVNVVTAALTPPPRSKKPKTDEATSTEERSNG